MACRLFSVKPLPEPMMIYCQLDPQENISVTFKPEFKKIYFKMSSAKMAAILPRGDEFFRVCTYKWERSKTMKQLIDLNDPWIHSKTVSHFLIFGWNVFTFQPVEYLLNLGPHYTAFTNLPIFRWSALDRWKAFAVRTSCLANALFIGRQLKRPIFAIIL